MAHTGSAGPEGKPQNLVPNQVVTTSVIPGRPPLSSSTTATVSPSTRRRHSYTPPELVLAPLFSELGG